MKYYFRAFKKYADSEGRASRRELIWFIVFHYLVAMILSFMDGFFGLYSTEIPLDYGYLTLAYLLAAVCPCICLQVRRLHDIGKSGSWWWMGIIPIINIYMFCLMFFKRGDAYINGYGEPIKYKSSSVEPTRPRVATFEEVKDNIPGHVLMHCENNRGNSDVLLDFLKQVARDGHISHAHIGTLLEEFSHPKRTTLTTPEEKITQDNSPETEAKKATKKPCYCRHCGEKLIEDSRFCRKCGTAVVELSD